MVLQEEGPSVLSKKRRFCVQETVATLFNQTLIDNWHKGRAKLDTGSIRRDDTGYLLILILEDP